MDTDPAQHLPWLLSRAFGLSAMIFLSLALSWGLAFSSRMAKTGPGSLGRAKQIHEGLSLTAIFLIISHGGVLVFDQYINPNVIDILVPFQMPDQTWATGIGIIAGWIAIIASGSYYARKYLKKSWKIIHRFAILAWILALIHTFGSGTETGSVIFPIYLAILVLPVVFALVYRLLPGKG